MMTQLRAGAHKARGYHRIFRQFEDFTMVHRDAYIANLHLVCEAFLRTKTASGCVIECGTWRGGMAAGLMLIGGKGRDYYFFDSFQGLPSPGAEDGEGALRWQKNTKGPRYFNNCTAS